MKLTKWQRDSRYLLVSKIQQVHVYSLAADSDTAAEINMQITCLQSTKNTFISTIHLMKDFYNCKMKMS